MAGNPTGTDANAVSGFDKQSWSPPRGYLKKDWRGNYHGNEGQLFYARDAKNLATALDTFLKGLLKHHN
jgi:hypothetical protein